MKVLPSDGSLVRAALVSYFDIGVSFGLGDGVFDPALVEDTGIVGLVNPLGRGRHVDLLADAPAVVAKWRAAAAAEIRPESLVAWAGAAGGHTVRAKLTRYVMGHPIERCYLRVYSVGTVYLHLQFAVGVAEECVRGLLGSFENAAYTAGVSNALLAMAADQARQAVARNRRGLAGLARRAPAHVQRDANGYEESDLIPSFTRVLLCVDEPDAARMSELAATWQLDPSDVVEYEHHGRLHFGWATCLVEPRYHTGSLPPGQRASPEEQVVRMLRGIEIAHVFLGTCHAFTRLFQHEMHQQVAGYVSGTNLGRGPEELNRLRTLALAVVNMTQFNLVAEADEDRAYFAKFAVASDIDTRRRLIQDACELLHNVQLAQRQHEDARRQKLLNAVLLLLTSLTLVSVTVDGYSFIAGDGQLIPERSGRILALAALVLSLALTVGVLLYATSGRRNSGR